MLLISHTWQLVHVHIWDNYIYIIWNHCNPNVTRNTGVHIFHIIGIYPWTNMSFTSHMCPAALLLWSTYRLHITGHTSYIHICASNKYAPQMSYLYHICQLLFVQIGDYYVSIYSSCKLNKINNMTINTDT